MQKDERKMDGLGSPEMDFLAGIHEVVSPARILEVDLGELASRKESARAHWNARAPLPFNNEMFEGNKPKHDLEPLANGDIRVVVCRFTTTVEDGQAVEMQALQRSWSELFVEPVTFAPICGGGVR